MKASYQWRNNNNNNDMAFVITTVIVLLSDLLLGVNGFNIDVDSVVIYKGAEESLFGFSVASHVDQGNGW